MLSLIFIFIVVTIISGTIGFIIGTHKIPKDVLEAAKLQKERDKFEYEIAKSKKEEQEEHIERLQKSVCTWLRFNDEKHLNIGWNILDNFFGANYDKYRQCKISLDEKDGLIKIEYKRLTEDVPWIDFKTLVPFAFEE